jgi:uncharacterized protein (DUF2225 family)
VKLFAQIFICPKCYFIAEKLYSRGEQELKMLLLVLRESIRLAIVQHNLQFSPKQLEEMKREDLLTHLQKLARETRLQTLQKEKACPTPNDTKTPCKVITKLPAASADGKPTSD